jgi:hypothetical protein
MKFVFLESGDSLELEVNSAPLIESWFEYLFENNLNLEYTSIHNTNNRIDQQLAEINSMIDFANKFLLDRVPDNKILFETGKELDQRWLNEIHRIWVFLTERYKNEIFPQPKEWHNVNHCVHNLEGMYTADFQNKKSRFLPVEYHKLVQPSDCEFTQSDIMLAFRNLGRHQHQQWLTGSDVDDETNNYSTVSLDIGYRYFLETGPIHNPIPAPLEYQQWCQERNLLVLPPWISIGKFLKYDRMEVRKLFYRNLKNSNNIGFML